MGYCSWYWQLRYWQYNYQRHRSSIHHAAWRPWRWRHSNATYITAHTPHGQTSHESTPNAAKLAADLMARLLLALQAVKRNIPQRPQRLQPSNTLHASWLLQGRQWLCWHAACNCTQGLFTKQRPAQPLLYGAFTECVSILKTKVPTTHSLECVLTFCLCFDTDNTNSWHNKADSRTPT